jgi:hypothetical protein
MIVAYGPVFGLVRVLWPVDPLLSSRFQYMAMWIVPFLGVAYWITKTKERVRQFTALFNAVAMALVFMPLFSIISYTLTARAARQESGAGRMGEWAKVGPDETISHLPTRPLAHSPTRPLAHSSSLPDVYYIILDRYASADVLQQTYGFDNGRFLSYLSQRGFYVVRQARSNYPKTSHSLASSLNMEFLDDLREKYGDDSDDWTPLYGRVRDYKVWRFLKSRGYQFIHVGSWWQPTSDNPHADVNINLFSLPEFSRVLYQMTMFYPFSIKTGVLDERSEQWRRTRYEFDRLAEIPDINEPTFVFAHFLVPHPPYVFARDGRFLSLEEQTSRSRTRNYTEQLAYTNQLLKDLVEKLLSRSPTPPIIILQADEGPFPTRYERNEMTFDWTKATDDELREKMGILNAYYLPNVDTKALYPTITPVNSFRLVFNLYFDTTFKMLPDESHAFVDHQHLYKFFNVTSQLKRR